MKTWIAVWLAIAAIACASPLAATADELVQEPPGATAPDFPNRLANQPGGWGVQNIWNTVFMYGALYF